MFEQICAKIKSGVGSDFYAITSDGWSKPTLSPQLQSVTIHWTDTDWNRQDMVFAAFPMDEFRHSGDVLAEKIATCLTEKGISMEKLVCCVRDDARNMQCAIRRMEKDSFQCCAHFLFSKANWALIEEDVQEFAKRMENENEFQLEEAGTSSLCDIDNLADDCDERSDDSIKFDIWKPKSPASISLPSAISTTSRIQVQLAAFKVDARPLLDTDIFSWWKQNGAQFPALDKIARVVHSIPATSVSSERLFSKAGLIYGNKLRNRLSGELVEKILVVKANMDNLQLAPSAAPEGEIFESDDVEDQEDQQYVLPEN
ncbi:hypothetical protein GPALN_004539 [Globodera pallida]|nr:hypothetical protein GPALN_004539 [Globodera pallida]